MLQSFLGRHRRDALFILLVFSVLLIWKLDIPYHHDELSALLRLQFDSFAELIEQGVRPDGHPAGTQVLLWGWTQIAGFQPMIVKAPFLLSGILSLILIYSISKRLFGWSSANFAAVLFVVLQYSAMYSGLARPYALGLLFVLLFVHGVLNFRKQRGKTSFVWMVVGAAGAAYTHYFAALQVLVIGILALFYLPRKSLLSFAGISLVAFLLWLPHLGITMDQLSIGGIGDWLQPPSEGFFFNWLDYVFNYSLWLQGILCMLIGLGLWLTRKARLMFWKERTGMLLLVLLPFSIAYVYSIEVNPLLHQGTLYFTFPFLLLFCTSFIRLPWKWNYMLVPVLFVVGVISLFGGRRHAQTHLATEYQSSLEWLANVYEYRSRVPLPTLIDLREDAVQFMFDKQIVPESELQYAWPLWENGQLMKYLQEARGDILFVTINAGSRPDYLAAALEVFPCIHEVQYYSSGASYILGKECEEEERIETIDAINLDHQMLNEHRDISDQFMGIWSMWEEHQGDAYVHASWKGGESSEAIFVMTVKPEQGDGFWGGVDVAPFYYDRDSVQNAVHCFYPQEMNFRAETPWKAYLWWKQGEPIYVEKISLRTFPRNPNKFGLFRPIGPTTP